MNAVAASTTKAHATAPLTEAQSGLWYAQRLVPRNPVFNTAHALWIDGVLDVAAFSAAVAQAVQETDALSLRMREDAGGPRQWIEPASTPWLEIVDVATAANPQAAAREAIMRDLDTPLDPARDPLAALRLFVLGPIRHAWYLRVHHLATDGYGMALFADRVCALYAARIQGQDDGKPLAPWQGVLDEDAAYRLSERRASDASWWRAAFTPAPEVAALASGKAETAHRCHHIVEGLDAGWRARLLALSTRIGQPWPDVLTALTALYVQRMSGVEATVVGVPYMGRLGSASARVPAMVMNILPWRVAPQAGESLDVFLNRSARELLQARRRGRYRSEQVRRDLGLLGGQRRLYGALVNVQPFYKPPLLAGTQVQIEILRTGPVDDLTLGFRGDGEHALDIEIEANPSLYSEADAYAHAARLACFLDAAFQMGTHDGAAPDEIRPDDIPLATVEEAQRYLFAVNDTAHAVPDTTLKVLIEGAMARTPDATALIFEGDSMSYAALDTRSAALARRLHEMGAKADTVIAIALPRSLELLVALVAVLRAGAAYLPLDLDHPPARQARVLDVAKPLLVLARGEDAADFEGHVQVLAVEHWPLRPDSQIALPVPSPGDAAYVIFTSGSTGEPKGVVMEHRAIVNRLLWMRDHYQFDASDRIVQKTPATFDVSVWELFLPLISGATLVIAPPGAHRDPAALLGLIREHGVTTAHFVPSMLSALLDDPAARGLAMRRVFCSGEALPAELRARFHASISAELHNLYGPTEAAVDVSYWPASPQDHSQPVPIGFPVWNTRLYVLDPRMRPLPPGVPGELYLGGVQLARGYLGRDDLTAERFIVDPFVEGERLYRTGDRARWRTDGAAEFLGRNDDQVKLRGLRIELGEIQSAIAANGQVARTEVMLREDRPGDFRLVAYVQPPEQMRDAFDIDALRAQVSDAVPEYVVPSAFVTVAHWPVNANGKLDRAALPVPDFLATANAGRAPASKGERALSELYAEVLGLPRRPDADADFFALGGDSLLAVRLLLRIERQFGRNPGLGAVFSHPTVARLAAMLDEDDVSFDSGLAPMLRLLEGDPALPPLFVIHPAGGIGWGYRHLARALSPQRPVFALQAPALDPSVAVPASVDALAAEYAARIVATGSPEPLHLVGWSVGGIIAQAVALRLREDGHRVGLVALLDAYPSDCWRDQPDPGPVAALRALLAIAGYDPDRHPDLDTREAIIDFLRRGDSALGNLPEAALDGVVRVVTQTNRLVRAHWHGRYPGMLTHVRAGLDHAGRDDLQGERWAPYTDALELIEVPFLHAALTGALASARIAPLLDARMAAAETSTENAGGAHDEAERLR